MLKRRLAVMLLFATLAAALLLDHLLFGGVQHTHRWGADNQPVVADHAARRVQAVAVAPASNAATGFAVTLKGLTLPYKVFATYVLPGESLPLAITGASGVFRLDVASGSVKQTAPNRWLWQAPQRPGLYPLNVRRIGTDQKMTLNVFVMVPYSRMHHGAINGYRIGSYPAKASEHPEVYRKPRGFIEVTRANEDTLIAPHFRLKQFLCKERGDFPKYMVLQERLLMKLEKLLAEVNARGYRVGTFTVMSGYRTPAYNRSLGNVKFSAHQYGMAADIYIDSRHRGVMDDLNHDGHVDFADAVELYRMADHLHVEPGGSVLVGGLGKYHRTAAHGPFVHVDVRGFLARWG